MSHIEQLEVEIDGEVYTLYVESTAQEPSYAGPVRGGRGQFSEEEELDRESMGLVKGLPSLPKLSPDTQQAAVQRMKEGQRMIRGWAAFAIQSFQNFNAAQIDELTLKFGIKLTGKAGIPFVTEGTAESNLEIQVKCSFPKPEPLVPPSPAVNPPQAS